MIKKTNKPVVILGICGSIAAYKSCDLIRRLQDNGIEVKCILTESGKKFITELTVQTLSHNKVYTSMFHTDCYDPEHVSLAQEASLVVIAPATADTIAKLAAGHANDLLSSVVLTTKKPVLVCPAMNTAMWTHPATKDNVSRIKQLGYCVMVPDTGKLACGVTGTGKLPEVSKIVEQILKLLK
jgi:phosphopantothenoylcysteine synthetase/decarboxylase